MKAKTLVVVLVWGVFLGVLAWRFGGTGAIEALAADVGCPGGQCFLKAGAAPQPGRADLQRPPRLGEPYPDLTLIDQTGQPVRLSSFKGSVILGVADRAIPRRRTVSDVEAAYRAIPHRRTVFDVKTAKMSPDERAFLRQLFDLIDIGIVERVEMLTSLRSNGRPVPSAENYERALSQLNALSVPPRVARVHRLIADAMKEQRAALEEWRKTEVPADLTRQPLVASSSSKLQQAYAELLPLFRQESAHNKAAFFDYLCAMDFV